MTDAVIDKELHKTLLQDLDSVCLMAGIPKALIYESATATLGHKELNWLVSYPEQLIANNSLLLTGKHDPTADTKMMAMTASMLRNFIDARVIPLNTLLDRAEAGQVPDPRVLLIPNLYVRLHGKTLPSWKIQQVYDILLSRYISGRLTVAYVEDPKALEAEYGLLFWGHLQAHFQHVGGVA